MWIDSHCHLDAAEFVADVGQVRAEAQNIGVAHCIIPAVAASNFDTVRLLAHRFNDSYALGIHPLYTPAAELSDLAVLEAHLEQHRDDPRLVAVGEIGLDYFVPSLDPDKQMHFYRTQLRLAKRYGLPVILHVRRSADHLLKGLREAKHDWQGIAHAFNGSMQQAQTFIDMGFALGFGGACTFERATQLRRLAAELPSTALVLETDAPDIPPHWLYVTAAARAAGVATRRNTPAELPAIAAVVAQLRHMSLDELARATTANVRRVLPLSPALSP